MYFHIPTEALQTRYPRLIFLLRCQGILSKNEAACCIRDYRMGRDDPRLQQSGIMQWGGGEAVEHYGGPMKLIRDALEARHVWRPLANCSLHATPSSKPSRIAA